MTEDEKQILKKQFNSLLFQLTELIKRDIYENTIVSTIGAWFETDETITELNEKIIQNVNERWEFIKYKIEASLNEFGNFPTQFGNENFTENARTNFEITKSLSEVISNAVGVLGSSFIGVISGGSGMALIASGLFGWIIGAVIGAIIFFYKSDEIKKNIENYIVDKRIPSFVKKMAKNKITNELKLNEGKFEKDVYEMLRKHLQPVLETIINSK